MPKIITHNDNTFEVILSKFSGLEKIIYNNREVSSKNTAKKSVHSFIVLEKNEIINYEIEILWKWHGINADIIIKRENTIVYSGGENNNSKLVPVTTQLKV